MWSPVEKCWVSTCSNSREQGYKKNFFPLPGNLKFKEIWLSLAGRKSTGPQEEIYFCQDHFNPENVETYMEKFVCLNATAIPYYNMPERICRTCMTTIMESQVFCVLSANVPSAIPPDIKSEVLTCRPEPLLQLLSFCVPELNLYQDPPPLVCFKCYFNIWLFYIYKLTCNAVEKELRGNLSAVEFGKMVLCRSCPMTSGTSFFGLKEDSSMGSLLKKMFLSNYSPDVVPLKVCLKCWNILYRLERFYVQCLSVEEKLQRHITLSHIRLNSASQLSTINPTKPQTQNSTNQLREYRKVGHPYQKSVPSTVTNTASIGNGKADDNLGTTANTSVIKFSEKQELECSSPENGTPDCGSNRMPTLQNWNIKGQPQASNCVQQNPNHVSADGLKKQMIENRLNKKKDVEQPVQKDYLPPIEEAVLAGLMLKNGQPLKFEGSAKQHFEVWVDVVRQFHQLGYDRPLETIQRSWRCMKNRAKLSFEFIGPATYVNQLVIDYLVGYRSNIDLPTNRETNTANKAMDCDIICIEDDEINCATDKATKVATPTLHKPTETTEKPPETTPACNKEKVNKKPMKVKKKKAKRTRIRWNHDQNLNLVRSMRKEHDRCLKSNELSSGRSPWQKIIKRLAGKEYTDSSFEKLYAVWGKLRRSATIHEKNGLDIVDDEVWDLLQVQNAVQKSILGKSSNTKVSDEKTTVVTEEKTNESSSEQNVTKSKDRNMCSQDAKTLVTNESKTSHVASDKNNDYNPKSSKRKVVIEESIESSSEQNVKKSKDRSLRSQRSKTHMTNESKTYYDDSDSDNDYNPKSSKRKFVIEESIESSSEQNVEKNKDRSLHSQGSKTRMINESKTFHDDSDSDNEYNPKPSKRKKVEKKSPKGKDNEKDNASQDSQGGKRTRHLWTESEKIQLFKLIKQQFNLMLKNGESIGNPWFKIANRISSNGYEKLSNNSIYGTWCTMRRNATSHENDGNRSILDDKILRLLKLYNRVKNLKSVPKKKIQLTPPVVPKVATTETTNRKKRDDIAKTTNQEKRDDIAETTNQEKVDDIAKRTNQEKSNDTESDEPNDHKSLIWSHQQKFDLISVVASYGGEVFKKSDYPHRHIFWTKVTEDFHAKGYKDSLQRVRMSWNTLLSSAKRAWADQKKVSPLDEAVIGFMTEVIQKNNKDEGESTEKDSMDEDHKDDKCDKISDTSGTINKSPTHTNGEEDDAEIKYDYVSLEDIEDYGEDMVRIKREKVDVDDTEEPLPFKIESYTSEQIIEISDCEED